MQTQKFAWYWFKIIEKLVKWKISEKFSQSYVRLESLLREKPRQIVSVRGKAGITVSEFC
jgi:hypothetical protein